MELIARRIIKRLEGEESLSEDILSRYLDPEDERYQAMIEELRREMGFTSLRYNRLDDMTEAVGLSPCRLCTCCWNGKE